NLPGVDGRVLNGSLLPARMAWNGRLTEHWSVLTAIGDGTVFAPCLSAEQSAVCIHDLAARIRSSCWLGWCVLNLHSDYLESTIAMHHAGREIVNAGFVPWTIRECFEWFESADGHLDSGSRITESQL